MSGETIRSADSGQQAMAAAKRNVTMTKAIEKGRAVR
jgi:hypothetical protein